MFITNIIKHKLFYEIPYFTFYTHELQTLQAVVTSKLQNAFVTIESSKLPSSLQIFPYDCRLHKSSYRYETKFGRQKVQKEGGNRSGKMDKNCTERG